ncbi:hypothetical protein ALC57_06869 [Trachymyrmex cornetzi]|uniref:Uncharacterized protein n=1 Tax=Trachymyrmex cornetzi TaxID=471704 RepID=A0A195E809_9HYME|nr:hypothetical protein ALC57_06869 [Trachymyrmex cornetzi]
MDEKAGLGQDSTALRGTRRKRHGIYREVNSSTKSIRKGGRRVTKVGEKTDAPARVRTRSWTMDLYEEENKVTSSVYMRVCASTYGTKEEEEDIKRVPGVSKKGTEEHSVTTAKVR